MALSFGLDFGTTNTLVSLIRQDGSGAFHYVDNRIDAPHPSIVLYKGSTITVGYDAKSQVNLENEILSMDDYVKSPKTLLGDENAKNPINGREDISRIDIVSEVLKYLKDFVGSKGGLNRELEHAVFTVPVSFNGKARQDLRDAANIAGINVIYFIHEPLAALYGHFRQQENYKKVLNDYKNKYCLVFDWGGGTLDLTVCKIGNNVLNQIKSEGDVDIGGDTFDNALQYLVQGKHATQHNISGLLRKINNDILVKFREACENAKKQLSVSETARVYIRNFLDIEDGPAKTLNVTITREEFEKATIKEVEKGIKLINKVLDAARIKQDAIALCLPTGGMINMPLIRNQLEQMFPGRVEYANYGDRIISEGAAWIGHDAVFPALSKPIELKLASTDVNNNFVVIAQKDDPLPRSNHLFKKHHSQFYVTDPSDGVVNLHFQSPVGVGRQGQNAPRNTLAIVQLEVDKNAKALIERITLEVNIDNNYVVHITAFSTGIEKIATTQIYEVDFSLKISEDDEINSLTESDEILENNTNEPLGITTRSLIIDKNNKKFIAGDIVENFYPKYMSSQTNEATEKQRQERNYYIPCSRCKLKIQQCVCN